MRPPPPALLSLLLLPLAAAAPTLVLRPPNATAAFNATVDALCGGVRVCETRADADDVADALRAGHYAVVVVQVN